MVRFGSGRTPVMGGQVTCQVIDSIGDSRGFDRVARRRSSPHLRTIIDG